MNDMTAMMTPVPGPTGELLRQLRRETFRLHRDVEELMDLPCSVSSIEDYVRLLRRLHGFHIAVEAGLANPAWAQGWPDLGIDLPTHRRSHLLSGDLGALGAVPEQTAAWLPALDNLGQALGCLYVVEGSSLGGRVLAPAFRAALGDVPTAFFESDGRIHPHPWRSVMASLRTFEATSGTSGDVVFGARETFLAFGRHCAHAARPGTGAR